MRIAVHITHESVKKLGGIGAVINGMCTTEAYKAFFNKTVIYGPLFQLPKDVFSDLEKTGTVLFSSYNSHDAGNYKQTFALAIDKYHIDIIYGQRNLVSELNPKKQNIVDVLLLGIQTMNPQEVATYKYVLWEKFGIQSDLYEGNWDNEQYLRIAVPLLEILEKLYGSDTEFYIFAHEYMGIPSGLSIIVKGKKHKTIFIAHEVSTARFIVESHPGHDISFYNIVRKNKMKKSFEEIFGSQKLNPRNELIKRAVHFDHIFPVGNLVKDEYLFLVPDTPPEKIETKYNGLFTKSIAFNEKLVARKRIEKYIETLFNFAPDVIFTHITRLVISKGIWRDISLLYYLDEIFSSKNLKGAYILLSTLIVTGRPSQHILNMESEYGWPVLHKEGWPDLVGAEVETYNMLQLFNSRSKAIKGVFLNQYGFNRERCGLRVPKKAEFIDLRLASDAEFGFSIYEPFGIAHIETIPFGGLSLLSSVCGSAFFIQKVFEHADLKPYYIVDFLKPAKDFSIKELMGLTREKRDDMERKELSEHVNQIFDLITFNKEKRKEYFHNAQRYAPRLDWEYVIEKQLLSILST
jgi:hypothetical protein